MEPYRVDTQEILHGLGMSIHVVDAFSIETIVSGQTEFVPATDLDIDVVVTNTGAGVVASGTANVDLTTSCSRCLEDFTFRVQATVEGFYTSPETAAEIPDDQEWEPIGDGVIDLSHAIDQAVRIELPFAPLHAEDCAGICPECGADRNVIACECEAGSIAQGPFAALRDVFPAADPDE